MKRKFLSLLLAACLLAGLLPLSASAINYSVTSIAGLRSALEQVESGDSIALASTFDGTWDDGGPLVVPAGKWVALDLAGHILNCSGGSGQGIQVEGVLDLLGVSGTITGAFESPGAICVKNGGVFRLGNTSIHLNASAGVYVEAGGTFTMNDGSISANEGGGVYVEAGGTFTMGGGVIHSNGGGGVYVAAGGAFTMEGGGIRANQGGGVYVAAGTETAAPAVFTMKGGAITENSVASGSQGAGVYAAGTVNMQGSVTVKDNYIVENAGQENETQTPNNVYLTSGNKIQVTGTLDDNALVGVSVADPPASYFQFREIAHNNGYATMVEYGMQGSYKYYIAEGQFFADDADNYIATASPLYTAGRNACLFFSPMLTVALPQDNSVQRDTSIQGNDLARRLTNIGTPWMFLTPAEGYYFPAGYAADLSTDAATVTRNSASSATVKWSSNITAATTLTMPSATYHLQTYLEDGNTRYAITGLEPGKTYQVSFYKANAESPFYEAGLKSSPVLGHILPDELMGGQFMAQSVRLTVSEASEGASVLATLYKDAAQPLAWAALQTDMTAAGDNGAYTLPRDYDYTQDSYEMLNSTEENPLFYGILRYPANLTLDLDGHTLNAARTGNATGGVTVKNGTLKGSLKNDDVASITEADRPLTLDNADVTVTLSGRSNDEAALSWVGPITLQNGSTLTVEAALGSVWVPPASGTALSIDETSRFVLHQFDLATVNENYAAAGFPAKFALNTILGTQADSEACAQRTAAALKPYLPAGVTVASKVMGENTTWTALTYFRNADGTFPDEVTLTVQKNTQPVRPTGYAPTILPSGHGTVTVSPQAPAYGATVTVSAVPEEGCELASLTVTDSAGRELTLTPNPDDTFSFRQPGSSVTIRAQFVLCNPFTDVAKTSWFYEAVVWAVRQGIAVGTSPSTFSPRKPCTRGQMVTFLWRAAGEPEPAGENPFTDVKESDYYYKPALWAAEQGITVGAEGGRFAPHAFVSREQVVTFVWRYCGGPQGSADLTAFTDADRISPWARDAFAWAVEAGLISGREGARLAPGEKATRAEVAQILKLLEELEK